jgi:dephospho-CoA kinase
MKLIALTGKARSGKDLTAQLLGYKKPGYIRIALADPLKKAVQAAFGLSYGEVHSPHLKEQIIEYWGMSPRQIMQQFGDAMKEKFGEDIFVKRWEIEYNSTQRSTNVVVPDCRCDVEADRFRELGGVIVEVQRGTGLVGSTGAHRTELGLSTLPDFVIDNRGDMDQLESEVRRLLEYVE